MPHVSELNIYPLKSAQGINLHKLDYIGRGPKLDRQWMVVNSNNHFLSQRQFPLMCLIKTQLTENELILSAPAKDPLIIHINSSSLKEKTVNVWKDLVIALDCGVQAANWISDYLNKDCRLVVMPSETQRFVDKDYANNKETVSFADGFPSLIISQASLDDFNSKLEKPINMAHFRPNIVIDDCPPYAEDKWQKIKINGIIFSLVKPCSRCIIPAIEPNSGNKRMDIIKALSTHRRRGNASYFGQNALHDSEGQICVGDNVELIS